MRIRRVPTSASRWATAASLVFHFGLDGLVEAVRMHDRPRAVDGALVPTRWEGRFWNYAEREGVFVPLDAEVAWIRRQGRCARIVAALTTRPVCVTCSLD